MSAKSIQKVSVHGGHSGQFCHHARDSLEEVIKAYIDQGYSWIGLTEHMPPLSDDMRYPDEVADNLSAQFLKDRFKEYFQECARLQTKYSESIEIYTAFETEAYSGSPEFVKQLIASAQPDYIVGSVHHVKGICIDFDAGHYQQAVVACGGIENLYLEYFDAQYEMIQTLTPSVVGHFDLIRIFDNEYKQRLATEPVWNRIERNLKLLAENKLILDYNLRGLYKGHEPYPCLPIVKAARDLGIAIVPGDDSHGVSSVGKHFETGVNILSSVGVSTDWKKPALIKY